MYGSITPDKQIVWTYYFGDTIQPQYCMCCNTNIISISNFERGHVRSRLEGGDFTIENLKPICKGCNTSMGSYDLGEFMKLNNYTKSKNFYGYQYVYVQNVQDLINEWNSNLFKSRVLYNSNQLYIDNQELHTYTKKQLSQECSKLGIKSTGNKSDIIRKIINYRSCHYDPMEIV